MLNYNNITTASYRLYYTRSKVAPSTAMKTPALDNPSGIFFFLSSFSSFFFFFFKLSLLFYLQNNTSHLLKTHSYKNSLKAFYTSYSTSFRNHPQLFVSFSRVFFYFVAIKNLESFPKWFYYMFSCLSRFVQFKLLRMLLCATTFIRNFLLNSTAFSGLVYQVKGKLSWKALSRKKKTVHLKGNTKKSDVSKKVTHTQVNLRTVTGSLGLKLSLYV